MKKVENQNGAKPLNFYATKTVEYKGKPIERRITFSGVIEEDNTLRIGMSMCSEKDNFTKKKGRAIAIGRAYGRPEALLTVPKGTKIGELFVNECRKMLA